MSSTNPTTKGLIDSVMGLKDKVPGEVVELGGKLVAGGQELGSKLVAGGEKLVAGGQELGEKLPHSVAEATAVSKQIRDEVAGYLEARKEARVYSGIDQLPEGFASKNLTQGCLVIEGGGFRGTYAGGVIDALMENDINMQSTIGVSAGALYGFCYTAGQLGSARINLKYRHDDRYVGGRAVLHNHGLIGWDFLFGEIALPCTEAARRFYNDNRRFVAVATNLRTAQPEFLEKGDDQHESCENIIKAVCGSASLPFISEPVEMGGEHYLDGGCTVKVPFQWAIDEGYEKIVVIRTRDKAFRKDVDPKNAETSNKLIQAVYGKQYPEFAEVLKASNRVYNDDLDKLEELEKQGRVFVIYPSQPVEVGRLESDMEKLGAVYHLGYDDAMAIMPQLKAYLEA